MSLFRKLSIVPMIVAVAASCSDSTTPETQTLTQAEKTTLANALASTGLGSFAVIAVQTIGQIGTLDAGTVNAAAVNQAVNNAIRMSVSGVAATSYEGAVGIAIEVTGQGWFYGVTGWNGINTSNNTVDEIVLVGGEGPGSLPNEVTGAVGPDGVVALYLTPSALYTGATGTASVTGSSFTGSGTDCSGQGFTCSYVSGSMNGNFSFTAADDSQNPYEQAPVHFASLPAVKITVTLPGN